MVNKVVIFLMAVPFSLWGWGVEYNSFLFKESKGVFFEKLDYAEYPYFSFENSVNFSSSKAPYVSFSRKGIFSFSLWGSFSSNYSRVNSKTGEVLPFEGGKGIFFDSNYQKKGYIDVMGGGSFLVGNGKVSPGGSISAGWEKGIFSPNIDFAFPWPYSFPFTFSGLSSEYTGTGGTWKTSFSNNNKGENTLLRVSGKLGILLNKTTWIGIAWTWESLFDSEKSGKTLSQEGLNYYQNSVRYASTNRIIPGIEFVILKNNGGFRMNLFYSPGFWGEVYNGFHYYYDQWISSSGEYLRYNILFKESAEGISKKGYYGGLYWWKSLALSGQSRFMIGASLTGCYQWSDLEMKGMFTPDSEVVYSNGKKEINDPENYGETFYGTTLRKMKKKDENIEIVVPFYFDIYIRSFRIRPGFSGKFRYWNSYHDSQFLSISPLTITKENGAGGIIKSKISQYNPQPYENSKNGSFSFSGVPFLGLEYDADKYFVGGWFSGEDLKISLEAGFRL